jgi:hypothetical protein
MTPQTYPSAVRNATFVGDDFPVANSPGVLASIDVTAVPGVDSVQLVVEMKVAGNKYVQIGNAAARTTTGTDTVTVCPGITVVANSQFAMAVPGVCRIRVIHSAGSNFTYELRSEPLQFAG